MNGIYRDLSTLCVNVRSETHSDTKLKTLSLVMVSYPLGSRQPACITRQAMY